MYYITTSRPYTNSLPHLGTILDPLYADVYARFYAQSGKEVFFSMGTDEHSFKIADKAKELNIETQVYANNQYKIFENVFKDLNISYDSFIQSSDIKHKFLANIIWKRLVNKGFLYKKNYSGLYCKGCEDFYSESQLVDGKCPIHFNLEIQHVKEKNYFFKLSEFKDKILDYLKVVKLNDQIYRQEMINFCLDLKDISVSRDRSRLDSEWGVLVEDDKDHIMYVWFEALLTYLTPLVSDELFDAYEEGDNDVKKSIEAQIFSDLDKSLPQNLQIIGADNAKFHLVIYPAILFALDLAPIEELIIHGMLNDSLGRKFAKSLGNGYLYSDLFNLMGSDGVRFFALFYCNSSGDTNFNLDSVIDQYNASVCNNLGNMVMRLATLIEKHFAGDIDLFNLDEKETNKLELKYNYKINFDEDEIYNQLLILQPELALRKLFQQLGQINQFLEITKPWSLAKQFEENSEEIELILSYCCFYLLKYNFILSIFLPESSQKIQEIFSDPIIKKPSSLFNKVERE
jgi:methionyl-tRNA synthetase